MPTTLRVVPVLSVDDLPATTALYADVLGLDVLMDHGWIVTLGRTDLSCQLSLMTRDATAPVNPDVSVEVDDVDAAYARALAGGAEIVHPLQDEAWGVRRFFLRDASGRVVNVLAHHDLR